MACSFLSSLAVVVPIFSLCFVEAEEREEVEIRKEFMGKLKSHNKNHYITITISKILRRQCLEISWTEGINSRNRDKVNHIMFLFYFIFTKARLAVLVLY